MIQRSPFVTTTWRVGHLVLALASVAYFCVHPVYSECCYSYSEQKLQPAKSSSVDTYSVALTASSWTAINSPGMTYKATVAFSSGYFIEVIPAGCTLVNQGTVSCSQAGKNMLSLAFQKITAVGNYGGSYLLVEPDAVAEEGVRKDYSTVPVPSSSYKPPATTPQPPPAVVSVQICGEFCTLSTSCSVPTSNTTATPTPTRSLNATATKTSLSTKTAASPTHTDLMTTPAAAPEAEPNTNSNKSAVIIGSIFAVVVVAFAVGYALMRRNMTLGAGRGGKKKKEVDQEEVKYIRPLSPAPPTLPQLPAPVAAPATAAMTTRQLDSASGGGVDLESQSRFRNPSPLVVPGPESRQRQAPSQQPSNTTSTRTATNTAAAAAAAAPMLARGRSVREAALTRNDRQQPPGTTTTLAGGGNIEPNIRYLQERQRVLAMNASTSASSAPALVEMSARSLASAPTYTLPQPPPSADPVNISVPVSISTMASLPLPVSTAAVNGSTTARTAPAETRRSNNSDSSGVNTADLEFLVIPVSNSSASARQRNATPSSTPPLATRGAEKEEVLEDVDLDDDGYGEREGTLLKKSKSMYPWSSRRGADASGNGVGSSSTTTAGTFTFADTSPLRRAASAGVGGSSGSKAINYNNNSSRNNQSNSNYNNNANTTSNYRSPYYQQPGGVSGPSSSSVPQLSMMAEQQQRVGVAEGNYYPQQQQQQQQLQLQQHYQQQYRQQQQQRPPQQPQQQQQQYQQKQQAMGWAQSQEGLLMRARSMPKTTIGATSTTAMNGGFPPRTMNTQQPGQGGKGQGQQQRADPRGLYGYL